MKVDIDKDHFREQIFNILWEFAIWCDKEGMIRNLGERYTTRDLVQDFMDDQDEH